MQKGQMSRRGIIAGLAAMPATAVAAMPVAIDDGADTWIGDDPSAWTEAELLEAYRIKMAEHDAELVALEPRFIAAVAAFDQALYATGADSYDPEVVEADETLWNIAAQIGASEAWTVPGMTVKARVLAWCQPFSTNESFYDKLVSSLIEDLIPTNQV